MTAAYDLANIVCTIGGITISGYGESDAIGFEWDADVTEVTYTADGLARYSRRNSRGVVATITLAQTSRAYTLLAQLLDEQHGLSTGQAPAHLPPLQFHLLDPATGDEISAGTAVFLNIPAPNKGPTTGEVEFRLHLDRPKTSFGLANTT